VQLIGIFELFNAHRARQALQRLPFALRPLAKKENRYDHPAYQFFIFANLHVRLRALDLYRVCQIAARLDVSVDWLLGRSDVMEVPKGDGKRVA
jgi:hypothetical protein